MNFKVLEQSATSHGQNVWFTRISVLVRDGSKDQRVRTSIRRDMSYNYQSTAKVELWTPAGWIEVISATPNGGSFLGLPTSYLSETQQVAMTRAMDTVEDDLEARAGMVIA
jgi:hypothetical protein